MAVCTVNVAVAEFFSTGGTYFGNLGNKADGLAGQRVVGIHDGLAVGDVGDAAVGFVVAEREGTQDFVNRRHLAR
mgnify:CR=1 FL=1